MKDRVRALGLMFAFAVAVSPALAAEQPKPKPATPAPTPRPKTNPCAQYGAGFVQIAGSTTCIKIGGGVTMEGGGSR